MADRADALLSVKTRMRDTNDDLLKVTRQWPKRRNLLRQKSRAALHEKVQTKAISVSARTKA